MSKRTLITGIAVALALVVVALFFMFNPFTSTQGTSGEDNPLRTIGESASNNGTVQITDVALGSGASAEPGDTVTVQYTGKLENGTVFDSSVGKPPFKFVLGSGSVIAGWDEGLVGMKVGGKRILIVPPNMGYGAQAVGPIPANSTLTFEVELLKIEPAGSAAPLPEGDNF